MPAVDRLRQLDSSVPEVDPDLILRRVRHQAHRQRAVRVRVAAGVAVVVAVATLSVLTWSHDDSTVDTTGTGLPDVLVPSGPMLPKKLPAGFGLAWVDVYEAAASTPTTGAVWTPDAAASYALGYQTAGLEMELEMYPGVGLDISTVRRDWAEPSEVISDEPGAIVVADGPATDGGRLLIQFDGGTVLVNQNRSESTRPFPSLDTLVSFARSFRTVSAAEWTSTIAGADLAPPTGVRSQQVLVDGDGWQLDGLAFRAPRAVTSPSLQVTFDTEDQAVTDAGPLAIGQPNDPNRGIEITLARNGDALVVAYGTAPASAATIRLGFTGGTVTAPVVRFHDVTAFAVEVGHVDEGPRLVQALDASGAVVAAVLDNAQGPCPQGGTMTASVPDVIGLALWDAIRELDAAGMTIIGTGTPPTDPNGDDAIVTAQEPPAGDTVPAGSCIGLRTTTP